MESKTDNVIASGHHCSYCEYVMVEICCFSWKGMKKDSLIILMYGVAGTMLTSGHSSIGLNKNHAYVDLEPISDCL